MGFAPIETTYKGINFRSRLEAKWAAFFDLLGWKWEYEPVDLNGWIPDFQMRAKLERMFRRDDNSYDSEIREGYIYVEVKPYTSFGKYNIPKLINAMGKSGGDVLLVGSEIFEKCKPCIDWEDVDHDFLQRPSIGWYCTILPFHEVHNPNGDYMAEPVVFSYSNNFWGLCKANEYFDFITGGQDKKYPKFNILRNLWYTAGNITQWKANGD